MVVTRAVATEGERRRYSPGHHLGDLTNVEFSDTDPYVPWFGFTYSTTWRSKASTLSTSGMANTPAPAAPLVSSPEMISSRSKAPVLGRGRRPLNAASMPAFVLSVLSV